MTKYSLKAAALLLTLSSTALAGGAGAPVGGGQIQPATVNAVAAAIREAGYKVTIRPAEPDRDPSMSVVAGDYTLDVWLSDCDAKGSCSRVTASTSWDYSDQEDQQDNALVNEWNSNYYTQAYIYEGSYYLDSTMPIKGGYTKAAIKAWMSDYLKDVNKFEGELP